MTDGAERAVVIVFGQLSQGTVAVYLVLLVVIGDGDGITIDTLLSIFQMLAHPPLVGPYHGLILVLFLVIVVHSLTGIDDEQLVDEAIAVPVVAAPVDAEGLQHFHDVLHEILRVLVVIIAGILHGIAFHLDVHQVKSKIEVTIALRIEVVVNRTFKGLLRQVLGIENLIPLR